MAVLQFCVTDSRLSHGLIIVFTMLWWALWTFCLCRFCFETLMRNLEEVKRKVESLTTSSLENLLGRIRNLASRPIAEFSRFEAMELLEAIKNAAHDSKNEEANYTD